MNRWICTEEDGYIIWGNAENVFAGGDVYNLG
jgi:hypothetical protein